MRDEVAVLTETAQEIGFLYRRAMCSHVESMKYLYECGLRLVVQKQQLKHGEWLPWLEANKEDLGFSISTAGRLMKLQIPRQRGISTQKK